MPSKAKATVKDFARLSGWSLGTVSRVLNRAPGVSEKAVADVERAIAVSGFVRNDRASALRRKEKSGVLILVHSQPFPYYQTLAERVKSRLEGHKEMERKPLTLMELSAQAGEDEILTRIEQTSCELVIVIGASRQMLMHIHGRIKIPAIYFSGDLSSLDASRTACFFLPITEIAQQCTELLFENGCRRIGILYADRENSIESADFILGVQYAFYSRNQVFSLQKQGVCCTCSKNAGYAGLKELVWQMPDLDGLLVFEENMALGALRAAQDLGYVPGEKLKVITLAQSDLCDYACPRLSAARRDLETEAGQLSKTALKMLGFFRTDRDCHIPVSWSMSFAPSCSKPGADGIPVFPNEDSVPPENAQKDESKTDQSENDESQKDQSEKEEYAGS